MVQEQKKQFQNQKNNNMSSALNGWLGRFIKGTIKKVAGLVDAAITVQSAGMIDSNFTEWADRIGEGGSTFWQRDSNNWAQAIEDFENDPRGLYEPTLMEQSYINSFSDVFTKFIEFS